MASVQRSGESSGDGAGAARKANGGKSNTVSNSPGGGGEGEEGGEGGGGGGSSSSKRPAAKDEPRKQPVPPKMLKQGIGFKKKTTPITIKLGASKPKEVAPALTAKKPAAVFDDDDDDSEPEEMPPEAKMRMKNIGRDTPTSAGPNSFNKGKQGFSDHQKLWERKLKAHTDK